MGFISRSVAKNLTLDEYWANWNHTCPASPWPNSIPQSLSTASSRRYSFPRHRAGILHTGNALLDLYAHFAVQLARPIRGLMATTQLDVAGTVDLTRAKLDFHGHSAETFEILGNDSSDPMIGFRGTGRRGACGCRREGVLDQLSRRRRR
jgi:hypothetical protein